MTAETDIAALQDGGANTAAEVRTALTSVLGEVPPRTRYRVARQTGETVHADDLFFASETSLTGTAVDGPGVGTGTWSLSDGLLKLIVASTGGTGAREPKARAFALTPTSAPVTIETHATVHSSLVPTSHTPAIMLGFSDGTAASSNIANTYSYTPGTGYFTGMLEGTGTFNANGFSGFNDTLLSAVSARFDVWQRCVWSATNTFQMQLAITAPFDGGLLNWSAGGTGTLTDTLTPTHFWVGAANDSATELWVSWDYIRVYESDLSA